MDSGEREPSKRPSPAPAQLPEEVIHCNILPRLPCRSLARFASVCKAWRHLILRDAVFAAMQAQSPSPASTALARLHNGRFEVLTPGADAAAIAPPDPGLSFLPLGPCYQRLELCACAGGLLCLTAEVTGSGWRPFFVVNPATREFHRIWWYGGTRGVAGLAYDPAKEGYDVVVAAEQGMRARRSFFRFSPRAAGAGWRVSPATARLGLFEELLPKAAFAGGLVYWLTNLGNIVWHDVAGDLSGTLALPCSSGGHLEGNMDLAAWRGRLRLACACNVGLGVWELASSHGGAPAARWEVVHWRSWCAIPGVVRPGGCFMWSVVPAGMEAGGEEALGLALRSAHKRLVAGEATVQNVWRRALVHYDTGTGATVAAVVLDGNEVHDDFGTVFAYHSSMAALPRLNLDA